MLYIDQYVYTNGLRHTHPLERVAFALFTLAVCQLGSGMVQIVVILLMIGLLVGKVRIPCGVVGKLLLVPLGFLLTGAAVLAISMGRDPEGLLWAFRVGPYYWGLTPSGLQLAATTSLKAFSSVTCLYFLALTTPVTELSYVLKLCRLPKVVIELMVLIYRFIFMFLETAFQIYTAQSSRWGYATFGRSLASFGLLFACLWGKAYTRARVMWVSLISRGYEDELRILHPCYLFSPVNLALIGITDGLLLLISIWGG